MHQHLHMSVEEYIHMRFCYPSHLSCVSDELVRVNSPKTTRSGQSAPANCPKRVVPCELADRCFGIVEPPPRARAEEGYPGSHKWGGPLGPYRKIQCDHFGDGQIGRFQNRIPMAPIEKRRKERLHMGEVRATQMFLHTSDKRKHSIIS